MLLKVEEKVSGQKVCKDESMKAPESKGMIRESYEHLASLGNRIFFKNIGFGSSFFSKLERFDNLRFFRTSGCLESGAGAGLRVLRGCPSTVHPRPNNLIANKIRKTHQKSMLECEKRQVASLGVRQIFKIFRIARGMDKSYRLGTETVGDHVKR